MLTACVEDARAQEFMSNLTQLDLAIVHGHQQPESILAWTALPKPGFILEDDFQRVAWADRLLLDLIDSPMTCICGDPLSRRGHGARICRRKYLNTTAGSSSSRRMFPNITDRHDQILHCLRNAVKASQRPVPSSM